MKKRIKNKEGVAMIYRISGIKNIEVGAEDKREAMHKAREVDRSVVWIEAEEMLEEKSGSKKGGEENV